MELSFSETVTKKLSLHSDDLPNLRQTENSTASPGTGGGSRYHCDALEHPIMLASDDTTKNNCILYRG